MKKMILLALVMLFIFQVPQVFAAEKNAVGSTKGEQMITNVAKDLVQTVADGCKIEIQTYCKEVTPGNGRVLACLYAYQDKLSNRCEYALYDASSKLDRVAHAMAYLADACKNDLKTYCADVAVGQGRVINCMEKNKDKLSNRCKQAFKETSVK